jgi:hypothetical protein
VPDITGVAAPQLVLVGGGTICTVPLNAPEVTASTLDAAT